ncbi:hypothetical protein R1flu_003637 [Riccia fluitans]|uniref:Uncharacterized protein n=1 Tax=Riccia fluitans TaxID=41844 RepID=A0ABD1YD00_9MARC
MCQAIAADPSRPLELHMHHHHHHYLASPTSPFSQTNSAPYFEESELAAPASDNFSPGPLLSRGHSDGTQRVAPSVLWIKNQISEDEVEKLPAKIVQQESEESQVTKSGGLIKRHSGSHFSNTSDIRSIEYPNKLSSSEDCDSERRSEREVTGRRKQTPTASKQSEASSLRHTKKEKHGRRRLYDSSSDESPTPTIKESRTIGQRPLQTLADACKPKCLHGAKEDDPELVGRTPALFRHVSETAERPFAITEKLCSNLSVPPHSISGSGTNENTNTGGIISASGPDNVSEFVHNYACADISEVEKQRSPHHPPTKAVRKNISSRSSRRQERRTPRSASHAEARNDARKTLPGIDHLESQVEGGKPQADKSKNPHTIEGNRTPAKRGKTVVDWRDAEKVKVPKPEMQSCLPCFRPEASTTKKHSERLKNSDSLDGNEMIEDVLSGDDRSGTEKLKSEYLQDPVWTTLYAPWNSKSMTQNRFREAVEAAWKTNLGTKSELESEDLNCEPIIDVSGDPPEPVDEKMSTETLAHLVPDDKSPAHEDTVKIAEEGMRDLLDERALFRAKFKEEMEQGVTDRLRLQELLQLEKFKLEATERELREVKKNFQEALLAGAKANQKHACESLLENQPLNTQNMITVDGIPMKLKSESEARLAAEAKASYFEQSAKAAEEKIQSLLEERNRFYSRFQEDLDSKCSNKTDKEDCVNHAKPKSPQKYDAGSSVPDKLSHGFSEDEKRAAKHKNEKTSAARRRQELEVEDTDKRRSHPLLELEESRQRLVHGMEDRRSKASTKHDALELGKIENQQEAIHDKEKQLATSGCVNSTLKNGKKRLFSPTSSSSNAQMWEPNLPFSLKIERCRSEDGKTTTTFDISPTLDAKGDSPNTSGGCKLEIRQTEFTESTNCSDSSCSDFVVKYGDEELVSRKVKSYSYDIPDKEEQHFQAEEPGGTISEAAASETDENWIGRSYQHSDSERSDKQSDLSPAESRGTSICSEEDNDAYKCNECPSSKGHPEAKAEESLGAELYGNNCDLDRRDNKVERGVRSPLKDLDNRLMLLPSKWKSEAKAELRRIIQEQELTWKIAEDAVNELGRRLELLERYKMELQDNLSRRRVNSDRERVWTRLDNGPESSPRGFSSLYHSPIFEDRLRPVEEVLLKETSRGGNTTDVVAYETHQSSDPEIQKLKADIEEMKNHIYGRDSSSPLRGSRACSPLKEDFRYSSSPPTPPLPPPPATPATPPTPPTVPNHQKFSNQERATGQKGSEISRQDNEVLAVLDAKSVQPENVKTSVTSQDTWRGSNGYSRKKVDRHYYHEDPRSGNSHVESRSWVPVPDDENVDSNGWSSSEVHGNRNLKKNLQTAALDFGTVNSTVFLPSRHGCWDDCTMPCKLKSDEGEVKVFKDAMRKISSIFWDQEGNLKSLKGAVNITPEGQSQYIQMRNFYVNLLREMSEQLGELCSNLQTDSSENNYNTSKTVVRQIPGGLEAENLRAALGAAERQIEEEVNINCQLKEKLNAGDSHLSRIMEQHAEELMRKDKTVSFAKQLNLRLANDMSATETSLAELRVSYKSLVTNLENQLKEAREEVIGLQSTLTELKVEVERNQSLVLDLELAGKEKQLEIQELTERMHVLQHENEENQSLITQLERAGEEKESQIHGLTDRMQALQSQSDEISEQRSELLKSIQELRREADNHQHHIVELVKINEELLEFAQAKEDEVSALTKEVTSLQQVSKGKSDEANKLAVEAAISLRELMEARRNAESYRTHCENLKSKLEQTEQELNAREDALERLTRHLETTIEGQDLIFEEKEQLLLSLSNAQYKERRMDDQIKQSKIIIEDLEDKLAVVEHELASAKIEITEMRARGKETLAIEKEAGEMRNRVHQLEEEIMEKEGQISILKSTYPGEFESTF